MQIISASRIGIPGKALFGVCHLDRESRRSTAVLLCNPLGVDGVGAHRTLVVLAETLARSGWSSLRFDYRYTGDSDGRCEEARLEHWLDDICDADAHLRAVSGCANTAWVGLGVGANLALAAATRTGMPPISLLLWEPIESTADFEAEFRAAAEPVRETKRAGIGLPALFNLTEPVQQIHGFPLPVSVIDEIEALTLERQSPPAGVRSLILASRPAPAGTSQWPRREIEFWRTTADEFSISRTVSRNLIATVMAEMKDLP